VLAEQHSYLRITRRTLARGLLAVLALINMQRQRAKAQGPKRPYFMPLEERDRLHKLILREPWANTDYARLKKAADAGDGLARAFLHALDGEPRDAAIAQQWLLEKYGKKAYWTVQAAERLNSDFFKGGQVGIPEVYYDIDISGYLAFDWAHNGLQPTARKEIEEGIVLWSHYKMRAMDRWTQTANLVFKPTSTVALAGLATDDSELIEWGFRRTGPWGAWLGGYDVVLDTMLKDGGPWQEAPIYPIAHEVLLLIARMSHWRSFYDQKDWFSTRYARGGSGRGVMDYYIDSAYPIERTGYGPGQIRVANYGDGSTNAMGDLILINPAIAEGNIVMHEPLIAAYNASRDPRYGAFVSMIPGYTPNLIDHPPVSDKSRLPPAPSKVWPTYGLAMLRSDESSNYWTSGKAIAVFQIMSKGYGHDHRDKFSISLHGAGRLFYPDYNALQYENPSVGWTRNSVSHNTLIVDEGETQDAELTALRHEFSPEVKFLASSADGVFEGVDQTRALLLTKEYLLDVFHATSPVPHTYDYVLHSFGRVEPEKPNDFEATKPLMKRYWLVDDQKAMMTSDPWMLDFIIEEKPGSRASSYGREWYDHKAKMRLRMAGEAQTLIVHGVWGNELKRLVSEQQKDAKLDQLATVVARRSAQRETLFAVCHEPYEGDDQPLVMRVSTLGRTKRAVVIRVDAKDFTDYAAVAVGPQPESTEHSLLTPGERPLFFAFKNYGYARIGKDGSVALRGDWTGLRLPGVKGPMMLNGEAARASVKDSILLFGAAPTRVPDRLEEPLPELPMIVNTTPATVRASPHDRRIVTVTLNNTLNEPVSGSLQFGLPAGLKVEPERANFGPVQPKASAKVSVTIVSNNPTGGLRTVPYYVSYRRGGDGKEVRTAALPLTVVTGPTLQHVYEYPRPYYLIRSPAYTVRADMFNGLHRLIADDDDTERLNGNPLFTLSDGSTDLLSEKTPMNFTWTVGSPASLTATTSQDRARWQAIYLPDRILIRMDPGWTQFEKTYFSVPGIWLSPQGAPRWKRIVALAESGKYVDVQPSANLSVIAAELEFPDAKWNLAFKFEPAQEVTFSGTKLKFAISSRTGDNWQLGFCRPGQLDAWRGA
jgi:Heparinase II/III-like protein